MYSKEELKKKYIKYKIKYLSLTNFEGLGGKNVSFDNQSLIPDQAQNLLSLKNVPETVEQTEQGTDPAAAPTTGASTTGTDPAAAPTTGASTTGTEEQTNQETNQETVEQKQTAEKKPMELKDQFRNIYVSAYNYLIQKYYILFNIYSKSKYFNLHENKSLNNSGDNKQAYNDLKNMLKNKNSEIYKILKNKNIPDNHIALFINFMSEFMKYIKNSGIKTLYEINLITTTEHKLIQQLIQGNNNTDGETNKETNEETKPDENNVTKSVKEYNYYINFIKMVINLFMINNQTTHDFDSSVNTKLNFLITNNAIYPYINIFLHFFINILKQIDSSNYNFIDIHKELLNTTNNIKMPQDINIFIRLKPIFNDNKHNLIPRIIGNENNHLQIDVSLDNTSGQNNVINYYVDNIFENQNYSKNNNQNELTNDIIAQEMSIITDGLNDSKPQFVIPYGGSGSGKTSTLFRLKIDELDQQGVIPQILSNVDEKFNKLTLTIQEIFPNFKQLTKYKKLFINKILNINFIRDNNNRWITKSKYIIEVNNNQNLDLLYISTPNSENNESDQIINFSKDADSNNIQIPSGTELPAILEYFVTVNRAVCKTVQNIVSSRSHVICNFKLSESTTENLNENIPDENNETTKSNVNFYVCDLAGKEFILDFNDIFTYKSLLNENSDDNSTEWTFEKLMNYAQFFNENKKNTDIKDIIKYIYGESGYENFKTLLSNIYEKLVPDNNSNPETIYGDLFNKLEIYKPNDTDFGNFKKAILETNNIDEYLGNIGQVQKIDNQQIDELQEKIKKFSELQKYLENVNENENLSQDIFKDIPEDISKKLTELYTLINTKKESIKKLNTETQNLNKIKTESLERTKKELNKFFKVTWKKQFKDNVYEHISPSFNVFKDGLAKYFTFTGSITINKTQKNKGEYFKEIFSEIKQFFMEDNLIQGLNNDYKIRYETIFNKLNELKRNINLETSRTKLFQSIKDIITNYYTNIVEKQNEEITKVNQTIEQTKKSINENIKELNDLIQNEITILTTNINNIEKDNEQHNEQEFKNTIVPMYYLFLMLVVIIFIAFNGKFINTYLDNIADYIKHNGKNQYLYENCNYEYYLANNELLEDISGNSKNKIQELFKDLFIKESDGEKSIEEEIKLTLLFTIKQVYKYDGSTVAEPTYFLPYVTINNHMVNPNIISLLIDYYVKLAEHGTNNEVSDIIKFNNYLFQYKYHLQNFGFDDLGLGTIKLGLNKQKLKESIVLVISKYFKELKEELKEELNKENDNKNLDDNFKKILPEKINKYIAWLGATPDLHTFQYHIKQKFEEITNYIKNYNAPTLIGTTEVLEVLQNSHSISCVKSLNENNTEPPPLDALHGSIKKSVEPEYDMYQNSFKKFPVDAYLKESNVTLMEEEV